MDASVEKVREAVENYFEIDELKHSPFDDRNVAKTLGIPQYFLMLTKTNSLST